MAQVSRTHDCTRLNCNGKRTISQEQFGDSDFELGWVPKEYRTWRLYTDFFLKKVGCLGQSGVPQAQMQIGPELYMGFEDEARAPAVVSWSSTAVLYWLESILGRIRFLNELNLTRSNNL